MNQPPKKRRRFSFSLRTLLIVVTACCLFLGWWTNSAQRQKRAVAWVEEQGGTVHYEWEYDDDGALDGSKELEPNWLRDWLGIDYFHTVIGAYITDVELSDILPLANLKHLEWLELKDTQVSDLSPLAELKNLTELVLYDTQVSEEEIKRLEKALPKLVIRKRNF